MHKINAKKVVIIPCSSRAINDNQDVFKLI